jgi:hypothetical protein
MQILEIWFNCVSPIKSAKSAKSIRVVHDAASSVLSWVMISIHYQSTKNIMKAYCPFCYFRGVESILQRFTTC